MIVNEFIITIGFGGRGARFIRGSVLPYSGYFSGGKIFVDMENFAGSWKKFRGYVYACTNGRGSLHLYGNCFVGKYFVVCFSTAKTTKILPPEKYPLYGILLK